jgi:hypothetical protein
MGNQSGCQQKPMPERVPCRLTMPVQALTTFHAVQARERLTLWARHPQR